MMVRAAEEKKEGSKGEKSKSTKPSKPIPHLPPPTTQQYLLFGVGVAVVFIIAAVRTYTKVRAGEPIPGYTQAKYMKHAE